MHPPLQTQLRFLNQAISFLTLQVSESKQRSEALRISISKIDRKNTPEEYCEALIQIAREERRLERVECELERVTAVVELFQNGQQQATPGGGGEEGGLANQLFSENSPKLELNRRERNLLKFLQISSPTLRTRARQYPSRAYSSARRVQVQVPSSAPAPAYTKRMMTLADVSPMRTRSSWSLDFMQHIKPPSVRPVEVMSSSTGGTLELDVKDDDGDPPPPPPPPVQTTIHSATPSALEPKPESEPDINGTATIFAYPDFGSYLRYLRGSLQSNGGGNVKVELPAYAKDLFDGFDTVGTALGFGLELGVDHPAGNEEKVLSSQAFPSPARSIRKTLSSTHTKIKPKPKPKRASLPPNFTPSIPGSSEMRRPVSMSSQSSSRKLGSSNLYLHPDSAASPSQRSQRVGETNEQQQQFVAVLQTKRGGGGGKSSSLLSIPESSLSYTPSGFSLSSSLGVATSTGMATDVGSVFESRDQDDGGQVDYFAMSKGEGEKKKERGADKGDTNSPSSPSHSERIVGRLRRKISMSSSRLSLSAVLLRSPGKG